MLLSSGRWDAQPSIGSVANPGSTQWEHVWGIETPGADAVSKDWGAVHLAYVKGAGDAHVYPPVPHPPETLELLRTIGHDSKPVFLSEYGIGSLFNAIREYRMFEQHGAPTDVPDAVLIGSMADRLVADWQRFGMDAVYAFPEDLLLDSQRLHARQRLVGFDLIRSNPNICGYNLTGMLDHALTGEGVWTLARVEARNHGRLGGWMGAAGAERALLRLWRLALPQGVCEQGAPNLRICGSGFFSTARNALCITCSSSIFSHTFHACGE